MRRQPTGQHPQPQVQFQQKDVLDLVLIWFTLTSAFPFLFFVFPWHPYKFGVLLGIVLLLLSRPPRLLSLPNPTLLCVLLLQAVGVLVTGVVHGESSGLTLLIQITTTLFLWMVISGRNLEHKFVKSYLLVLLAMGFGGWIVFLTGLTVRIEPLSTFARPGSSQSIKNFLFTFSNSVTFLHRGTLIRVAGYFDEPGTFAYYLMMGLMINRTYQKDRKVENFLIISGIPTLSLAFLITVALLKTSDVGLSFFRRRRVNRFKANLTVVVIVFVGVLTTQYLFLLNPSMQEVLNSATVNRWSSIDYILEGGNRARSLQVGAELLRDRPLFGFGVTGLTSLNTPFDPSSIMGLLVRNGIIPAILILSPVWFWAMAIGFRYSRGDPTVAGQFPLLIIFMANLLQRPQVIGPMAGVVLLAIIHKSLSEAGSDKRVQWRSSLGFGYYRR